MKKYIKVFGSCLLIGLSILIAMSVIVAKNKDRPPLVCIDAGHGGDDVGATSPDGQRLEKDDNLEIAILVRDKLVEKGIDVFLTRDNDSSITLKKRVTTANRKRSCFFVSLHRNSSLDCKGKGVEIWISSKNNEDERLLAQNILDKLVCVGVQSVRGIHIGFRDNPNSDYYINKYSDMTSCLVEIGFINNEKDNELFDEKLEEYAAAVADGIELSLGAIE
ncbi:MAG TPA: N-acetylmuramoyl-L-alanine amidase [Clostridia bacterium]|nr:N-acetylmuramoyl-L-alanine amidase [Clostridia bacterium]